MNSNGLRVGYDVVPSKLFKKCCLVVKLLLNNSLHCTFVFIVHSNNANNGTGRKLLGTTSIILALDSTGTTTEKKMKTKLDDGRIIAHLCNPADITSIS